jgi:hypothetical protein
MIDIKACLGSRLGECALKGTVLVLCLTADISSLKTFPSVTRQLTRPLKEI